MSAKQDEASSRGQRSKTTGSPNLIGPWPISCPAAPCGPGATMKSSAVQPCSANTRRIAALTRSTVSGSPSSQSTPSPFSACASARRPPRGRPRRRAGAPDALELGAGLDPPARVEHRLVDRQLDAVARAAGRGTRTGRCGERRRASVRRAQQRGQPIRGASRASRGPARTARRCRSPRAGARRCRARCRGSRSTSIEPT